MALAEVAHVEAALRRVLVASEVVWLPELLAAASERAERYCGRRFARVVGDTVTLLTGGTTFYLPSPPVTAVTSVTSVGAALTASAYQWDSTGLLALRSFAAGPIVVTYTHGFDPVPADVALAVGAMAGADLDSPGVGVVSESIDGYSTSWESVDARRTMADALVPYRLPSVNLPIVGAWSS